jgi:hypothetical protein
LHPFIDVLANEKHLETGLIADSLSLAMKRQYYGLNRLEIPEKSTGQLLVDEVPSEKLYY